MNARRFTLRNYWREILLLIMSAMLVWTSLTDDTVHTGSTYTNCHTTVDTITDVVHTRTTAYRTIQVPQYITDTIYNADTLVDYTIKTDTVYEYINMPLEEYSDGETYYARTLGYLDSISVYQKTVTVEKPVYRVRPLSIYLTNQLDGKTHAPGAAVTWRRLHVGYNYQPVQRQGVWTMGIRLY